MRLLLIFLLFLVSPMAAADGFKILFVANSLTYYNDVPRAVAALLEAEGTHREVEVEMLAEGGATLDQHLQGAAFDRTLKAFAPDVVVLQDRGPYPMCEPADEECRKSPAAFAQAVVRARAGGAMPVLFGTWHGVSEGQVLLSGIFDALARQHGARLADVGRARVMAQARPMSLYLDRAESADAPWWRAPLLPDLDWPPPDGHPAEAGGWLAAATLARAILGHALAADLVIGDFCRAVWPGAGLSAARVASVQLPKATTCATPDAHVIATSVMLANRSATATH